HRIFIKAMEDSCVSKKNCVMVGDRLDIDIYPANVLGIKTIRTLNSIYRVQKPINHNEKPLTEINSLNELPNILSTWF
ncbi:MAG: HAD family hydrolase, partial [Candidatus Nitrosocosmicus sp.]